MHELCQDGQPLRTYLLPEKKSRFLNIQPVEIQLYLTNPNRSLGYSSRISCRLILSLPATMSLVFSS